MEKVEIKKLNIVFFDGICHLCNGFVDTVISKDKAHFFQFAPLQGETSEQLLKTEDRKNLDTVVYYEAGKTYYRSAAILKILTQLDGGFKIFALGWLIPRPLRDLLYKMIAKNRYTWFGTREFCRLPNKEEKNYLLP